MPKRRVADIINYRVPALFQDRQDMAVTMS